MYFADTPGNDDVETLIACTFDATGNAMSTGPGGERLEWLIDAGADGDNGIEFVGSRRQGYNRYPVVTNRIRPRPSEVP